MSKEQGRGATKDLPGGLPKGFADAVCADTYIRFGWWDRLHLLFSGALTVTTRVATEHAPGRTMAIETGMSIAPIIRRKPKHVGYLTSGDQK